MPPGHSVIRISRVAAIAATFAFIAPAALAAPINYNDFVGVNVSYLQVTEETLSAGDPDGLFGAPSVFGDQLDFNPVGFAATASGAAGLDITDVELTFGIKAKPNRTIETITLTENGDYTLLGVGTTTTLAAVAASVIIEVFEVEGTAITPVQITTALAFAPSGGTYDLATEEQTILGTWSGSLVFDVAGFLDSEGILDGEATLVQVTLDNQLVATSEDGTTSFIAKKDTDGLTVTATPEPGTGLMLMVGLLGLARAGRPGRSGAR